MRRLVILAVGRLKDLHLRALAEDYATRLRRLAPTEVVELRDGTVEQEGTRILQAWANRPGWHVALAEEGTQVSSRQLADTLAEKDGELIFTVGGPFGLAPSVKSQAHQLLSLSRLTFTHEMARVLLLEQLYRACSIQAGGKYHHD